MSKNKFSAHGIRRFLEELDIGGTRPYDEGYMGNEVNINRVFLLKNKDGKVLEKFESDVRLCELRKRGIDDFPSSFSTHEKRAILWNTGELPPPEETWEVEFSDGGIEETVAYFKTLKEAINCGQKLAREKKAPLEVSMSFRCSAQEFFFIADYRDKELSV